MTSFTRTQRKDVQKAYRVRNWREYETGLRARGSLTVWLGLALLHERPSAGGAVCPPFSSPQEPHYRDAVEGSSHV